MRRQKLSKASQAITDAHPIVVGRITSALGEPKELVKGLPLSLNDGGKLINYSLIEMGVTGLCALAGVPFEKTSGLATKLAASIALALEQFEHEGKIDASPR